MLVFRAIPSAFEVPAVLTIGNFDGVHLGHQALLARARSVAADIGAGCRAAVMTFEPHPREFFSHEASPLRLTSLREKLQRFRCADMDAAYVCRFNRALAGMSADAFIDRLLVRGVGVQHVIVGDDFRFGQGRAGDFALLKLAGASAGFSVESLTSVQVDGERVSSSAVRAALERGDLDRAARLLGRAYSITGRVEHGAKLGRTLGFPTANVQLKHRSLPLSGVFVVRVSGDGFSDLPGAASLGVRPSVEGDPRPTCEVHLLDFERSLYGQHITLRFEHMLRAQRKYDSLDALSAAIADDVAQTRTWFACNPTKN